MEELGFFESARVARLSPIRLRSSGQGVRYALPRRHDPVRWVFAGFMLLGGLLVAGCSAAAAITIWQALRPQDSLLRSMATAALAVPLVLLSLKGAWTVLKGVLMALGHAEVVLTGKRLRAIERAGPIVRWESRPARCLRRLVLLDEFTIPGTRMSVRRRAHKDHKVEAAAIQADCDGAAPLLLACDYSPDWLRVLAHDLAANWEQLVRIAPGGGELPALEVLDGTIPGAVASPSVKPQAAPGPLPADQELLVESLSCERDLRPRTLDRIQSELAAGERVVWIGRPSPRLRDARGAVLLGLFCAGLVAVSACFMLGDPPREGFARVAFVLFSQLFLGPLLLLAAFLLAYPLLKRFEARRTYYVLTNLRAMVFAPRLGGRHQVGSFLAEQLGGMTCKEREDGSGDLLFRAGGVRPECDDAANRGFLSLRQVRPIEHLVRKTLLKP